MNDRMPLWMEDWMSVVLPAGQVLLIILVAALLQRLARRVIQQLDDSYHPPPELRVGARRVSSFIIWSAAFLLVLERLGVSGPVLWTAFTSFAAVAAVAFFAAWSVLSNIFCTMLIFTTRPFRLDDQIELLESGEKPGFRGRVIDINLIYTTLQEITADGRDGGSVLQIPNNLFFQRTVRRWPGHVAPPRRLEMPG